MTLLLEGGADSTAGRSVEEEAHFGSDVVEKRVPKPIGAWPCMHLVGGVMSGWQPLRASWPSCDGTCPAKLA